MLLAIVALIAVPLVLDAKPTARNPFDAATASPYHHASIEPTEAQLVGYELEPATLDGLLNLPASDLDKVDIARVNLLCATDLPGAGHLNAAGIDHALATLDEWARRVHFETERHVYRATDPRYAEHYGHSEAYLRAEFLMQVLCEDLGVKYDMTAMGNFDFRDSRVAFIHGMIPTPGSEMTQTRGGTCASMPVLAVAVGRRLGYPLKLVTTDGHVFVRWDGADHPNPGFRGRFNMEVTNGFSSFEDDYYKTWPYPITDADVRANGYLLSLTPSEELSLFLAGRGHCGEDNGEFAFAARCFENAYRYDTRRPAYRRWFAQAAMRSNYHPLTPALASDLSQRRRHTAARGATPNTGVPMPSEIAAAMYDAPDALLRTSRIGAWRGQPGSAVSPSRVVPSPFPSRLPLTQSLAPIPNAQPNASIAPYPSPPLQPEWGTP